MLLIREKENQIQDLSIRESKSNIKIWWWLVNLTQKLCETMEISMVKPYVVHIF